MDGLSYDVAHLLAGGLVLVSFMMIYQDRLYSLLNVFALHAVVLSLAVAWQALYPGAHHLYATAGIALFSRSDIESHGRCTGSCSASASTARSRRWWASA